MYAQFSWDFFELIKCVIIAEQWKNQTYWDLLFKNLEFWICSTLLTIYRRRNLDMNKYYNFFRKNVIFTFGNLKWKQFYRIFWKPLFDSRVHLKKNPCLDFSGDMKCKQMLFGFFRNKIQSMKLHFSYQIDL